MQDPLKVSPLIRLGRYTMLFSGIFYGFTRRHILVGKENEVREEEIKKKAIRDAEMIEIKKQTAENEREALEILSKPPT